MITLVQDGLLSIIGSLDLRKIVLSGRQFTWARVVRALTRTRSCHTPLLVDFRNPSHHVNKSIFSFLLSYHGCARMVSMI